MHPLLRAGAAFALGARLAAAQPADPPIPAELVRAMMTGPFGGGSQTSFVIGKLPPSWPNDLTLGRAASTLGLLDTPYQRTAVFQTTETPELVIPDLTAAMRRVGWTPPPPRPQPGGFGAFGMQPAPPAEFCRGDSLVVVSGAPRLTGGYVYVALRTGGGAMQCHAPAAVGRGVSGGGASVAFVEARSGGPGGAAPVPVPVLQAPDGVQSLGSSSSGGYDRWDGETRLRSALPPAALLDLYGQQLARSGWTLRERVAGASVATQVAERRDSTGTTWRATLTASAYGDSLHREMALRIVDTTRR